MTDCYINWMSLVVSIAAFFFSLLSYYNSFMYEKRKATIEAYNHLQVFLHFFYEYQKDEIEDFVNDKHSDEYKVLSECLAQIEFFATGIINKAYDFRIAYQMAHGFLDLTLRSRIDYMLEMKNESTTEHFYYNTEKLLHMMDRKSKRKIKK